MDQDAILLHCNERYQPCGWTAPINRITDLRAFQNQVRLPARLNSRLWQEMLRYKTINQSHVLRAEGLASAHLERAAKQPQINEADCARRYWQLFFPAIGYVASRRDRKENSPPNQMLNYGYSVLAALCHRALIIHGLLPQLGLHHKPRYRSEPLVYDLMEPFRPMVDWMLAEFLKTSEELSLCAWAKKVGTGLRELRLSKGNYTLKLLDAIDVAASSLARAYAFQSAAALWIPELMIPSSSANGDREIPQAPSPSSSEE
ncbi:MAG: type II CRISPR-associated endonuclease Cas1 [Verrucomicrobiae bacterium]|nr:type II CRISPR-associated endonuclease Cas1 [Verrucomicrobiae bacterium]